jgi:type I restriction enzyme R subunit
VNFLKRILGTSKKDLARKYAILSNSQYFYYLCSCFGKIRSIKMSNLSEEDIKRLFITPALESKWDAHTQIRMEKYFTDGRVIVRGDTAERVKGKKADYMLFFKPNLPLAIVEAKDNSHSAGAGMQQAIEYAEILDIPFAYSSNGSAFLEHDMKNGTEREIAISDFPTPIELWNRYKGEKLISEEQEKLLTTPYHSNPLEKREPRYYQRIAINRTIEAIAKGQNRILLVMATGTGKTYTAFQIIHRLWKSGAKKKILYLADRNILIDQTIQQDFKPFKKVMTKISGGEIDSSYEIYLSLYHQLAGDEGKEPFRDVTPDFFDLIIVDECHRGSAKDDSQWRRILEYFSSATQIGMTATPKETKYVSNIYYFGEPVYTYTLKQGIDDGFLAPYKVIRTGTNVDVMGWRPTKGQTDDDGNEIEDREYASTDYDRNIILVQRTQRVAERITRWLRENDRFAKTIVFCTGVNHAERMRQALINLNSDMVVDDSRYIMRITGDDAVGKKQLDNFIDVESRYPVVAATSKLLSTGVDCKTCKLIVLDSNINSMTEFKQIIGRGTRLLWDDDKRYFTILDFRNVTRLFADKDFDGEPISVVQEYPIDEDTGCDVVCELIEPYGIEVSAEEERPKPEPPIVTPVKVEIIGELVKYYDVNGKLITESITDYSRQQILGEFATLNDFLHKWNSDLRKQAIIDELRERGVLLDALHEAAENRDMDDFDLICHIAFDKKPLTKAERANNVKKRDYLNRYEGLAREVLTALLDKYAENGIQILAEGTKILEIEPFREIGALQIANAFGGKQGFLAAIMDLQREIYREVA